MIAVVVQADVTLAGISVPAHRTLEVIEDLAETDCDVPRTTLTLGEARALVHAGLAEPVEPDFDGLSDLIDGWQRA